MTKIHCKCYNWYQLLNTIAFITFMHGPASAESNQIPIDDSPITVTGNYPTPDEELRLQTVSYRLATSNSDRCPTPHMLTGLVAHDLSYYESQARTQIQKNYSISYGFVILSVVKKSAAFWAGFKPGDQIVGINGASLVDFHPVKMENSASFERTGNFEFYLAHLLDQGIVVLTVERSGSTLQIPIEGQLGCGGYTRIEQDTYDREDLNGNAWYDGVSSGFTKRLVNFTKNNDELAFIVAHQMAHNIMGDFSKTERKFPYRGMGMNASDTMKAEIAADNYAIAMVSRTAYNPAASIEFINRASQNKWLNATKNHPQALERVAIVTSAISTLNQVKIADRK